MVIMDEQGNWVRILNGNAAVCVNFCFDDESQPLGKPEKVKQKCVV